MASKIEGRHIHIRGIVQGVGFRPFVYGLATRYKLAGWVLNNSSGIEIEITGSPTILDAFIASLRTEAPPLAVIDSLDVKKSESPSVNRHIFEIRHSQSQAQAFVPISPDISICDDCRRELFDPADRRFRYPFINCTNCGPRFTIIRDIPYDRPLTTMVDFSMCQACRAEYQDPLNRRFHAQPNACPDCGPQISFRWAGHDPGRENLPIQGDEALQMAQKVLAEGGIVAVKGLGGFHLAGDATNDATLQTLRRCKGRIDKPFAVMAPDIPTVEQFAKVTPEERALLTSKERPIVLLKKKPGSILSEWVAPGNQYVGVMLPYTPLHYLLLASVTSDKSDNHSASNSRFATHHSPHLHSAQVQASAIRHASRRFAILVMTSGNYSEEPIVKGNLAALERLASLADAFLLHNRDIHVHCDDSVVRVFEGHELPIRRSRGYAPFPVKLPFAVEDILAVGGELKNTFCLTKDNYAFMSQHIGDMENLETWQAFEQSAAHFQTLFRVEPTIIACDLHPGYLSTKWAKRLVNGEGSAVALPSPQPAPSPRGSDILSSLATGKGPEVRNPQSPIPNPISLVSVQHHHAHIAAVMAEHGLDGREPVLGFSFDGTGYGPDGAIWGGEMLLADYESFERVAHLKYVPLPGGDAAVKRPYRTALAHLWAAGVEWAAALPSVAACSRVEQGVLKRQLETGLNSVPTSSMGRLFDAVASLAGVRQTVTYEAQAAIEFEALMAGIEESYQFGLPPDGTASLEAGASLEIDAAPVIRAVAGDVLAGVSTAVISARFHHAVADLVLQLSRRFRQNTDLNVVALSGGVFQNVSLLDLIVRRLRSEKFEVLTHRLVPPNDGGLALGQAMIAGCRNRGRE